MRCYSWGSHSMGMFLKVISPLSSPHLATNFTMERPVCLRTFKKGEQGGNRQSQENETH
jgi:hypothetical protein